MDKERFIAVWLPKILNIFGLEKTYTDMHIHVMDKRWDSGFNVGVDYAFELIQEKIEELKKEVMNDNK
jgi:hypothetical protein